MYSILILDFQIANSLSKQLILADC